MANERVPMGQLYVLRKGMCVRLWRFLGVNAVWGEDMLIEDLDLVCHAQAVALTYVECIFLTKANFEEAASDFPAPMLAVYKKLKKVRIMRRLLKYLAKANGSRCCRSFIEREHASGFSVSASSKRPPAAGHGDDQHGGRGGGGTAAAGAEDASLRAQIAELMSNQQLLIAKVDESQRMADVRMAKMASALSAIQGVFEVWAGVPPAPASAHPPGPPMEAGRLAETVAAENARMDA